MRPKKVLKNRNWEEFRKTYEEVYPFDEPLTEEHKEYLKTHLLALDNVKKVWYLHAMRTWTKEDYDNYVKFHLWILGVEDSEKRKGKDVEKKV